VSKWLVGAKTFIVYRHDAEARRLLLASGYLNVYARKASRSYSRVVFVGVSLKERDLTRGPTS
jgi:hypothetical protein